ncbi:MAG: biotin/lipoyl-binding protein [Bryobacterales bacterium]
MKALIVILLGAAAVAGLGMLLWNGDEPALVAIAEVQRADIEDALVTNGRIEAAGRFDLYAETSGRVLRVEKSVGDTVQPGAVIATLDSQTAGAELAQAQARVEAARAELAVFDNGLPVQQRLDLQAQIETAEAQRRALRSDLERSKRLIEKEAAPKVEAVDLERAHRRARPRDRQPEPQAGAEAQRRRARADRSAPSRSRSRRRSGSPTRRRNADPLGDSRSHLCAECAAR